jgi:hypothetical protein
MKRKIFDNKKLLLLLCTILVIFFSGIIVFIYYQSELKDKEETVTDTGDDSVLINTINPPTINQAVALEIQRIHKRGIEDNIRKIGLTWKQEPRYYFLVDIRDAEWKSNEISSWDTGYVGWEAYRYVENETVETVLKIKIIDITRKPLGIAEEVMESFQIEYNFKTGRWTGDDFFNDSDGYGHYLGNNYEIWFNVFQTDNDYDNIPFWTENNILKTDPYTDDSKEDPDNDGIPTSWEWKWGYDPFSFDNHSFLDPDNDGLENTEEYLMRKWLANPFYKDIYLEVDFMEKGPELFAIDHILHKESQWILMDVFSKHQISVHIDDGWPTGLTNGGGEFLPYAEEHIGPFSGMASSYYKYHFSDERKGIFRYVLVLHDCGWNFAQDHKLWPDVITIPSNKQYFRNVYIPPATTERLKRLAHGVVLMHELGHSLGLNPSYCEGIDNASHAGRNDLPPIKKWIERIDSWRYWWNYQSVMNYQKLNMYYLDYSDGSHGLRDKDDWSYIDLTFFQTPINEEFDISDS